VSSHITYRLNYIYILTSLLYTSRKNMQLCQNIMSFLSTLLELEIVKIDFLIGKACLLQVLINLLRFYSNSSNFSIIIKNKYNTKNEKNAMKTSTSSSLKIDEDEKNQINDMPIINDFKNFFCLITRHLLK
jgi:hypothetical protein